MASCERMSALSGLSELPSVALNCIDHVLDGAGMNQHPNRLSDLKVALLRFYTNISSLWELQVAGLRLPQLKTYSLTTIDTLVTGMLLAGGWLAREASSTHPPARMAQNPYWRVGEWRGSLAQLTHRPLGNAPLVGVLPYYSVGRTQYP